MNTNGSNWQETKAGQALQARLTEEKTLNVLTRLLDRIDVLEESVNGLANMMGQGPGMVAMLADMADETVQNAKARGVDFEARVANALLLAEKFTAPETTEKLDQLLQFTDQAPGLTAMMADMADDAYSRAAQSGVDINERLGNALQMAEKLTAPKTVDKFNQLLVLADQAPGLTAMMADMADEAFKNANAKGIDLEGRISCALGMAEKLTTPGMSEKLELAMQLADQAPGLAAMAVDIFDEEYRKLNEKGTPEGLITLLSSAGEAVSECHKSPPKKVGLFGLIRALRDPDLQRTLGFLTQFGSHFGKKLS